VRGEREARKRSILGSHPGHPSSFPLQAFFQRRLTFASITNRYWFPNSSPCNLALSLYSAAHVLRRT
jgi:hypothetical protein